MKYIATPAIMQKKIDDYFAGCDKRTVKQVTKEGVLYDVPAPMPYTVEGLALAIGFTCVQTLWNYEKTKGYEKYFETIKTAKLKIQKNKIERGLLGSSVASVTIFDLKNNHGYKDKTEVESINKNLNATMSDSDLEKIVLEK